MRCVRRSGSDSRLPGGGEPAVYIRLTMAAHKPVEWVQAVINRFDEQVKRQIYHGGIWNKVSKKDTVYSALFLLQSGLCMKL